MKKKLIKKYLICAIPIVALLLFANICFAFWDGLNQDDYNQQTNDYSNQTQNSGSANSISKPSLQIPIPTITFSDKICSGEGDNKTCQIGWIGEYITGIYKYAVYVISIIAVIVMMWGGIVWLTAAGNSSQIGEAKKWIGASLSGLVIMLCSYLILYQINPNLTIFKPLEISQIKKIEIDLNMFMDIGPLSGGGDGLDYTPSGNATVKKSPYSSQMQQWNDLINEKAKKYGVDPELIKAIMLIESSGNQNALGPVTKNGQRAMGLMQLMPGTAAGCKVNASDPVQNVECGTALIKTLLKTNNNNLDTALAYYNYGEGNVKKNGIVSSVKTYINNVKYYYNYYKTTKQ